MNRTVGIVITVVTALCCGCLAIFSCIFGGMIAAGTPITQTLNGVETVETYPQPVGFALLCVSLILIIIPIVVGFFTLRNKPAPAPIAQNFNEPLPPAS
jgi:TRAP-type C4-dicarboxylate transport system permease small subunit